MAEEVKPLMAELAPSGVLAESELTGFNNLLAFASVAGKIMGYIADTLRPGDFEEFIQHALAQAPNEPSS